MASPITSLSDALDALKELLNDYLKFPNEHCAPTVALWIAHTWRSTDFYTSPRLVFSSAVPGSAKTRGLELCALTCFNARLTISSSTAALFRRIGAAHHGKQLPPTILFDETDSIFNNRPSETTEQLRGLMNAGYKRGATVDRCEGDSTNMKVVEWPVFAPLALAGLAGHLPDTIATRAIIIEMKKKKPTEKVRAFRSRNAEEEAQPIVDALANWALDGETSLADARPLMPEGVVDRAAEVWEPLLAVADQASPEWGKTARAACTAFVFAPSKKTPPVTIELLRDIRTVMGHDDDSTYTKVDRIPTDELISRLKALDEAPWATFGGESGLTPRRLSRLLSDYDISPDQFKLGQKKVRGYFVGSTSKQVGFSDAWERYLPPVKSTGRATPLPESGTTGTSGTPQVGEPQSVPDQVPLPGTVPEPVLPTGTNSKPVTSAVPDVPLVPLISDTPTGAPRMNRAEYAQIESFVVDYLSSEYPWNLRSIKQALTVDQKKNIDDVDQFLQHLLDDLTARHIVTQDSKGRYLKFKETA